MRPCRSARSAVSCVKRDLFFQLGQPRHQRLLAVDLVPVAEEICVTVAVGRVRRMASGRRLRGRRTVLTLSQSPLMFVSVPMRVSSMSCRAEELLLGLRGVLLRWSTVSRNTLPLFLMLETSSASSSGVSEGSMKNTSMNSARSRSAWFLMREKALMRSAWRYRGNGHLPNRSRALSSMPTIRMSGRCGDWPGRPRRLPAPACA